MTTSIQPPVGTHPITGRGEVLLPIGVDGEKYKVRFGLAVLNDYTTATGKQPSAIGDDMSEDPLRAIANLVVHAVRRYVPGSKLPTDFGYNDALDVIDSLGQEEADALAEAIWSAIRIDKNPLMLALIAKAPKPSAPEPANGADTSTSLSAS